MADVFISYKREDRRAAERLSIALEQLGFDVWWDFDLISGDQFRHVIEKVIDECAAVIVLWSALSRESTCVVDEAGYAKEQGKLCPARIDDCRLPLGFGGDHVVDLRQWIDEMEHEGLQALVRALENKTGKKARVGARARDAGDEVRFAEMEAFKAAQAAENASALRAFLHAYPQGAFANFVRGQLVEMEARVASGPPGLRSGGGREGVRKSGPNPRLRPKRPPWPLIAAGAALAAIVLVVLVWPRGSGTPLDVESPPVIDGAHTPSTDPEAQTQTAQQEHSAPPVHEQPAVPEPPLSAPREQTAQPQFAPYDLAQLHPGVRRAVEAARAAEHRAEAAAARAREAASRAQGAAPRDGVGVSESWAGNRYAGEWANGVPEGFGIYTYTDRPNEGVLAYIRDAARYEGEFKRGAPHGVGVIYWPNGGRYVGALVNGNRSGPGVYYAPSGRRREGNWSEAGHITQAVWWDARGRVSSQDGLPSPLR